MTKKITRSLVLLLFFLITEFLVTSCGPPVYTHSEINEKPINKHEEKKSSKDQQPYDWSQWNLNLPELFGRDSNSDSPSFLSELHESKDDGTGFLSTAKEKTSGWGTQISEGWEYIMTWINGKWVWIKMKVNSLSIPWSNEDEGG
ncbi:MAG: hypothetical protein ABIG39_04500 [Candidatus Micrarchaeota archaeon]